MTDDDGEMKGFGFVSYEDHEAASQVTFYSVIENIVV